MAVASPSSPAQRSHATVGEVPSIASSYGGAGNGPSAAGPSSRDMRPDSRTGEDDGKSFHDVDHRFEVKTLTISD